MWEERNLHPLLVGMPVVGAATMETSEGLLIELEIHLTYDPAVLLLSIV